MARARVELAAFEGLSFDGLPIAYLAFLTIKRCILCSSDYDPTKAGFTLLTSQPSGYPSDLHSHLIVKWYWWASNPQHRTLSTSVVYLLPTVPSGLGESRTRSIRSSELRWSTCVAYQAFIFFSLRDSLFERYSPFCFLYKRLKAQIGRLHFTLLLSHSAFSLLFLLPTSPHFLLLFFGYFIHVSHHVSD